MDTIEFLENEHSAIIDAAQTGLGRMPVRHYESAGEAEVNRRLEALFDRLVDGLARRDLTAMVEYAQAIAVERFGAG